MANARKLMLFHGVTFFSLRPEEFSVLRRFLSFAVNAVALSYRRVHYVDLHPQAPDPLLALAPFLSTSMGVRWQVGSASNERHYTLPIFLKWGSLANRRRHAIEITSSLPPQDLAQSSATSLHVLVLDHDLHILPLVFPWLFFCFLFCFWHYRTMS